MAGEINRKDLGKLEGQVESLQKSQQRMEGKIDCIDRKLNILPDHTARIGFLEQSKRNWIRAMRGIVIIVLAGGVMAFMRFIVNME